MRPGQLATHPQLSCPLPDAHLNSCFQGAGALYLTAAVLAQPGQLLWSVEDA